MVSALLSAFMFDLIDNRRADIEVSIAAMVAVFEYAESLWGPLEKFAAAITLKGVRRKNVDMKWIKLMGAVLQNQYPERLKCAYLAPGERSVQVDGSMQCVGNQRFE